MRRVHDSGLLSQVFARKKHTFFSTTEKKRDFDYLCPNLILRKMHNNIKVIYKVQQADRNTIVRQMKTLLNENVDMWRFR